MRGGRNLVGETPRQRAENSKGDGDEIGVDPEDFPDQQWSGGQIALPFHDPNEEEIQDRDAELGEGRKTEKKFEVVE
jgi:hypothetical protein